MMRNHCLARALLMVIASLVWGAGPSPAQTSNMVTVTWNFINLTTYPQAMKFFSLTPLQDDISGTNFVMASPIGVSAFSYPAITNGSFTTNVVCGVDLGM